MNLSYKLLKKAKRTGRQDVRQRYKTIRNEVTKELRCCKAEYYNDQFQKVKNTKSFWKLINKASNSRVDPPPAGDQERRWDPLPQVIKKKPNY